MAVIISPTDDSQARAACAKNLCKQIEAYGTCADGKLKAVWKLQLKDCDKCKRADGYCDDAINEDCVEEVLAKDNKAWICTAGSSTRKCNCIAGVAYAEHTGGVPVSLTVFVEFKQKVCNPPKD